MDRSSSLSRSKTTRIPSSVDSVVMFATLVSEPASACMKLLEASSSSTRMGSPELSKTSGSSTRVTFHEWLQSEQMASAHSPILMVGTSKLVLAHSGQSVI